jgi:hypothetical protein
VEGVNISLLACLLLTLVGLVLTVPVARRRGPRAAVRLAAWALVPTALWLTGLIRLLETLVETTVSFAVGLVFSPLVWAGMGLFALTAVLLVVARRLPARPVPAPGGREVQGRGAPPAVSGRQQVDAEMAEIEELLRRRGIT